MFVWWKVKVWKWEFDLNLILHFSGFIIKHSVPKGAFPKASKNQLLEKLIFSGFTLNCLFSNPPHTHTLNNYCLEYTPKSILYENGMNVWYSFNFKNSFIWIILLTERFLSIERILLIERFLSIERILLIERILTSPGGWSIADNKANRSPAKLCCCLNLAEFDSIPFLILLVAMCSFFNLLIYLN